MAFNVQKILTTNKTLVNFSGNNSRSMIFTNNHATDAVTVDLYTTSQVSRDANVDITATLVYSAEAVAATTVSDTVIIDNGSGSASAATSDAFLNERVYKSDGSFFGLCTAITTTLLTFSGGLAKGIANNDILYTGTRYYILNNVKIPNGASLKLMPDEFNMDTTNYKMYINSDSSTGGIDIITRS